MRTHPTDFVEENDWIHRFEGLLLPFAQLIDDGIGDRAHELRRHLNAVHFLQEALDFPNGHTRGVHRDDLVVEASEAPFAFGDEHWVERPVAIAWNIQFQHVIVGRDPLAAAAVAMILAQRRCQSMTLVDASDTDKFAHQKSSG